MALLVRGHERGSYRDGAMAAFVGGMGARLGVDAVLFVHTWCESEAKLSHRPLSREGARAITEGDVRAYFGGAHWVGVDDDDAIRLPGDAGGRIGGIPARAWKNMWYGKHRAVEAMRRSGIDFDVAVCVRTDVFRNMESQRFAGLTAAAMDKLVLRALSCGDPQAVHFPRDAPCLGIDNFYAGTPAAVARLVERFHLGMDEVRLRYPDVYHQEYMVLHEARRLASEADGARPATS